ncbi:hypothetical protein RJT34_03047 [Clitoria ternatea]|uniref:Uncharacterized protein n=1 Tax=Clitoria ternatea TaxID=43366 RepID=A0AAN9Q4P5_CLITE
MLQQTLQRHCFVICYLIKTKLPFSDQCPASSHIGCDDDLTLVFLWIVTLSMSLAHRGRYGHRISILIVMLDHHISPEFLFNHMHT